MEAMHRKRLGDELASYARVFPDRPPDLITLSSRTGFTCWLTSRAFALTTMRGNNMLLRKISIGLIAGLLSCLAHAQVVHTDKVVEAVHSPDHRACLFFSLAGVATADPITPNMNWFSVPMTHPGFKEIVAILISARTSGQPVTVYTTGNSVCGHASVSAITL